MSDSSPRRGIVYPSLSRVDVADVPLYIKNVVDKVDTDVQYLEGTLAARPSATLAGRIYRVTSGASAGYIFFDNGSSWDQLYPIATGPVTTVGVSPPASPNNGDLWYKPVSGTDYYWQFLYDISGSYYWKFVGGPPITIETVNPSVSLTVDASWHIDEAWLPQWGVLHRGRYLVEAHSTMTTVALGAEGFGYAGIGVAVSSTFPEKLLSHTHFGGLSSSQPYRFTVGGQDVVEAGDGGSIVLAYFITQDLDPNTTTMTITPIAIGA